MLHLHRLHHQQDLAPPDAVTWFDMHTNYAPGHRRDEGANGLFDLANGGKSVDAAKSPLPTLA